MLLGSGRTGVRYHGGVNKPISRTCLMVAAGRALGAREKDPAMRNPDSLAEKLLGPEELALIEEHPIGAALRLAMNEPPAYEAMGTAILMLIRTKFIDEKLQQAVENGAQQVVILGAGFDTRAYRLNELLKQVKVFEVDGPATQQYKRKRIETVVGPPPANLTYVSIDFNHENLMDALLRAGYDPAKKTFFTWEGVSMYVVEAGVRQTLESIAKTAPGSSLVMDYTTEAVLDFMKKFPEYGPAKFLDKWGEPWVFGIPDGKERGFFQSAGLTLQQQFPVFSPESMKRYLTRPDGTPFAAAMPPPKLSEEAQNMAGILAKNGTSFYSLAELTVKHG